LSVSTEENLALPEQRVLLGKRLLDLEQELGLLPDLGPGRRRRSDRGVRVVLEGAARSRTSLDEDVVPALNELPRACGRERDAVLVGLDLLDDSDLHRGEKP